ncbi:MAG: HU family DNA-binding protein [Candidatus Phlomobacter fragariae]
MNKISEKANLTKKNSEKAINTFIKTVKESLKSDNDIQLIGFGSFRLNQEQLKKIVIQRHARLFKFLLKTYLVLSW